MLAPGWKPFSRWLALGHIQARPSFSALRADSPKQGFSARMGCWAALPRGAVVSRTWIFLLARTSDFCHVFHFLSSLPIFLDIRSWYSGASVLFRRAECVGGVFFFFFFSFFARFVHARSAPVSCSLDNVVQRSAISPPCLFLFNTQHSRHPVVGALRTCWEPEYLAANPAAPRRRGYPLIPGSASITWNTSAG